MLDNLLFFLGIKSYDVQFPFVSKIDLFNKDENTIPYKNIKIINSMKLEIIEDFRDYIKSPNINKKLIIKDKLYYTFYNFYFVFVNFIVLTQPVYNLYNYIILTDRRHLTSFFIHSNLPIIHLWLKYYFRTDHLEKIIECKKFKSFIIILSSIISIIINFCDFTSFRNEYIWLNNLTSSDIVFSILILIDWIYTRLIIFIFVYTFIFVLRQHNKDIAKTNKELSYPEEVILENSICLSNIILDVADKKNQIIKTINLFNTVVTFTTLIGGISSTLFFRSIVPYDDFKFNFNFDKDFDRYLLHGVILIIINQVIMVWNIYTYTKQVDTILSNVKSYNFIKRYLYRIHPSSILNSKKCQKEAISLMNLSISEDSALTLDWMILCDMLSDKWLEFTFFGISTSDGKLIKKAIALAGGVWFSSFFMMR